MPAVKKKTKKPVKKTVKGTVKKTIKRTVKRKTKETVWQSYGISILVVLLLIFVGYNAAVALGLNRAVGAMVDEALESDRPSEISLITIVDGSCSSCPSLAGAVSTLKGSHVTVESERTIDYGSGEAGDLVKKYKLTKVPALIVTGEIDRDVGFESMLVERDGALVLETPSAPYTDPSTGQQKGFVEGTIVVNSDCVQCSSLTNFFTQLQQTGVVFVKRTTLDYADSTDSAVRDLISLYDLNTLPAVVLSKEIREYPDIVEQLITSFSIQEDDSFVSNLVNPPYFDLTSQSVVGLVELTLLTDESCESCYDVALHKPILSRLGLVVSEERTVDISSEEGTALVSKYSITKVPTIVLSSEAITYLSLKNVWPQVGSIEEDGTLIFTRTESMGAYKDLSTGEVITQ